MVSKDKKKVLAVAMSSAMVSSQLLGTVGVYAGEAQAQPNKEKVEKPKVLREAPSGGYDVKLRVGSEIVGSKSVPMGENVTVSVTQTASGSDIDNMVVTLPNGKEESSAGGSAPMKEVTFKVEEGVFNLGSNNIKITLTDSQGNTKQEVATLNVVKAENRFELSIPEVERVVKGIDFYDGVYTISHYTNSLSKAHASLDMVGFEPAGDAKFDSGKGCWEIPVKIKRAAKGVTQFQTSVAVKGMSDSKTTFDFTCEKETIKPQVNITSSFKNGKVVGKIEVIEQNIDKSDIQVTTNCDLLGDWEKKGDKWTRNFEFTGQGAWNCSCSVTDIFGNEGSFAVGDTVDTIKPEITLSEITEEGKKGYLVSIEDANLDINSISIETNGENKGLKQVSPTKAEAKILLADEEKYNIKVTAKDTFKNVSVEEKKNILVDSTKPRVRVSKTVKDGIFREFVSVTFTVTDKFFDPDKSTLETNGISGVWKKAGDGVWTRTLKYVNDGRYHYKLTAVDTSGNETVVEGGNTLIDTTKPVITVDGLKEGGFYKKGKTFTIRIKDANFDPTTGFASDTSGRLGEWAQNSDIWENSVTFDAEGIHHLKLQAVDKAGNKADDFNVASFEIDATAPKLKMSGVESGTIHNSNQTVRISCDEKNFNPKKAKIETNGVVGEWKQTTVNHWEVEVKFDKDGTYNLTATVKDKADNESNEVSVKNVIIDKTAPVVKVDGIEKNKIYAGKASGTLTIVEKNFDKSKVKVSGASIGEWTQNGDTWTAGIEQTKEGVFDVKVSVVDKAGNSSALNLDKVEVDQTKPVIELSGAKSGKIYAKDTVIKVRITEKNFSEENTKIETNGVVGTWKNLGEGIWENSVTFGVDGDYSIKVTSADVVGNAAETVGITNVSVDKTAPTVEITGFSDGKIYPGNVTGQVKVVDRHFNPNGARIGGASVGEWVQNGDVWTAPITATFEGNNTVTLTATDVVGNVSKGISTGSFIIDKTAPKVTMNLTGLVNGKYSNNQVVANLVVEDANFDPSGLKVTGGANFSGWSRTGNVWRSTAVFGADGVYNFSATATDKAEHVGNTVSSNEFIVDRTKPQISISGVQNGVSYHKGASGVIKVTDTNLDPARTTATLVNSKGVKIAMNGGSGSWSFGDLPRQKKYDGYYTLKVVGYDLAGNYDERTVTFSVNRFGSDFEFTNSDVLGKYIQKAKTINIVERSIDRLNTANTTVKVFRNGKEIKLEKGMLNVQETKSGEYVYTYSIDKKAFKQDGKYVIQIFSKTADGMENSSLSQEMSFVKDGTKPEIIASGVKTNGVYKAVTKNVVITVKDLSPLKTLKFYINGKEVKPEKLNDTDFKLVLKESSEKYDIKVVAVDKAGNSEEMNIENIYVTSSIWGIMWNNIFFKIALGALTLGICFLIAFLWKRKRDKENERMKEVDKINSSYKTTSGSGTGGSSSARSDSIGGTGEK